MHVVESGGPRLADLGCPKRPCRLKTNNTAFPLQSANNAGGVTIGHRGVNVGPPM